jgi:hypothetical protein
MTAPGLQRRIAQLEEARLPPDPPPTWVQIIFDEGESEEEVKARYVAEHAEMPTPTHWIIRKIVSPNHPGGQIATQHREARP